MNSRTQYLEGTSSSSPQTPGYAPYVPSSRKWPQISINVSEGRAFRLDEARARRFLTFRPEGYQGANRRVLPSQFPLLSEELAKGWTGRPGAYIVRRSPQVRNAIHEFRFQLER